MLRAWKALARFEGRSSVRSWLYRIATNTCLDLIGKRPQRVLPINYSPSSDPHEGPGAPLVEQVWVEPYPDDVLGVEQGPASPEARFERREAVELSFIAALQHLPAQQRAVLILREVLGFSAREVSEFLESTEASVNSAMQRARATIDEKLPERSQQETLEALGNTKSPGAGRAVRRRLGAGRRRCSRGDAHRRRDRDDAADAHLVRRPRSDPRVPVEVRVREGLDRQEFTEGKREVRLVPASASGQVALGAYRWTEDEQAWLPYNLQVLRFDGDKIAEIGGFVMPEIVPRYGLPDRLTD